MSAAPGPVIRPARPDDVLPIAAFDGMGGDRGAEVEAGHMTVVEHDGEVVAYASVVPAGLLGQAFLSYLCVRRDQRRQGRARALLQAVLAQTPGRLLLTSTENWCTEARALFESLGGQCVGSLEQVNRDGSAEVFYRFTLESTLPVGTPPDAPTAPASGAPMVHVVCGLSGLRMLPDGPAAVVIVDVLSFSTCVEVACSRGATVVPVAWKDAESAERVRAQGAIVAGHRAEGGPSLSPLSLASLQPGQQLLLRSPNGASLSLAVQAPLVLAGCLRNASAVAAAARQAGGTVVILAAGEQCAKGPPRFALEDWLGAGAIVHALGGQPDAAALAAQAAFLDARRQLPDRLADTPSGQELTDRGWPQDVACAAELDVSLCVPRWSDGCYADGRATC